MTNSIVSKIGMNNRLIRARESSLGLAVGNAISTTVEFKLRGTSGHSKLSVKVENFAIRRILSF